MAGLAAAGLVAVGVTIGQYVERTRQQTGSETSRQMAKAPDADASHTPARPIPESVTPVSPTERVADRRPGTATTGSSDAASLAYRLAVVDHIAGSEAMITAFRGAASRGEVDAQLAKWSRDLLGETRLLEGSAPPDDVEMKRLLEDLELVLSQIVQYTNRGTHSADDLDLIERSIKHRAVMTNIRTMSAGRLPSGT